MHRCEVLKIGVEEAALETRIRESKRRGSPLGSEAFVEEVGRAESGSANPAAGATAERARGGSRHQNG